jgi:hypothetical protein
MTDELSDFVKTALARGVSRAGVEATLRQAGWTVEQVKGALAGFADVDFPIPVPRPRPYLSAREAFIYLVLFATLYASAYHIGVILFEIIDRIFPDSAFLASMSSGFDYTDVARRRIRWSVASLIVSFPVFLYLAWLQGRAIRVDPNKRNSKVRRWLTYLTLFGAATVLIGDLTVVLYNFLGGEITTRFLLKALVVGAIAGVIFGYYLTDLRREESELER